MKKRNLKKYFLHLYYGENVETAKLPLKFPKNILRGSRKGFGFSQKRVRDSSRQAKTAALNSGRLTEQGTLLTKRVPCSYACYVSFAPLSMSGALFRRIQNLSNNSPAIGYWQVLAGLISHFLKNTLLLA